MRSHVIVLANCFPIPQIAQCHRDVVHFDIQKQNKENAPPVRAVHKVHKDVAVVGQIPDTEEWTEWDKHDQYRDKFRITDTDKIVAKTKQKTTNIIYRTCRMECSWFLSIGLERFPFWDLKWLQKACLLQHLEYLRRFVVHPTH